MKNINEFSSYKKLFKLEKKRSPLCIEYITNDSDEWLITVLIYKKKTQQITDIYMILQKEIEDSIDRFIQDGYSLTRS